MVRRALFHTAFALLCLPLLAFASPGYSKPVVEVAFVLDTTGSMGQLIEGAKRKIWSIATSIAETNPDAEIRMGLVAYRDIGDEYVTKTFELTTDIQELYGHLLSLRARGGGDWPESVNEALEVAIRKLAWSSGPQSARILFLVGDAPPHMDYPQDTKYPEVIRTARQKGIIVNAVQAGSARDTERVWREIAQLGDGRYIPIPQDGGQIVMIETPYDTEIIELQVEINRTVIPYGSRAEQMRVEKKQKQVAAAPRASASDMASYINKRAMKTGSAEAVTGAGDLVADIAAGRMKMDAVKDDQLPDDVRRMSSPERQAHLERQMQQRRALNERLAQVVAKRDRYVTEQRKAAPAPKTADSFDRVVEETLRTQLKR